jgi:demethylmenaquinone methyltransferase/2-methoxy-6-polyprenyl-1,4-benzoquinol methylase
MIDKKTQKEKQTTHFGFTEVPLAEKTLKVKTVFDSVSSNYDLMNDMMSFGIHHLWKSSLIDQLNPKPGMDIIDVAGGTGDIAKKILKRCSDKVRVTICDINANMLKTCRNKSIDNGQISGPNIPSLVCGNAEELPFADASVDAYTIAFGLRNVTKIDIALKEARRVLKPGGHFLCLEFSEVVLPIISQLYDKYSFFVLPKLGEVIANDRESYVYLVESIRKFPKQEELVFMLQEAKFSQISYKNLSGGIAAIHSAWRI